MGKRRVFGAHVLREKWAKSRFWGGIFFYNTPLPRVTWFMNGPKHDVKISSFLQSWCVFVESKQIRTCTKETPIYPWVSLLFSFEMDQRHFSAMFYFYAIAWAQTSFLYLFMFRTIKAAEDHCNFFGVCHVILSICAFFIGMYVDSNNAEVCFFVNTILIGFHACGFCVLYS